MSLRYVVCIFTLAAAMAGSPRASAQSSAPSGPTNPTAASGAKPALVSPPGSAERAASLYKEGVRLYVEKKWAEAELPFQQAWALNPTADVAYNLGSVEYRLGKFREAATHLAFALRNWPLMEAMAKQRAPAEQRYRESRAAVGALVVKVSAAGAEVFVDGQSVGRAPLADDVFVAPGAEHVIEAKLDGFAVATERAAVAKGETKAISLTLVALASAGGANGKPAEPGNVEGSGAPKKPGDEDAKASEKGGPKKALVIAGVASSGALIAAGAALAIVSSVKGGNAEEQRTALLRDGGNTACESQPVFTQRCSDFASNLRAEGTFRRVSVSAFLVGGAFGAATAIYAVAARAPTSRRAFQVAPIIALGGGAVIVTGRW